MEIELSPVYLHERKLFQEISSVHLCIHPCRHCQLTQIQSLDSTVGVNAETAFTEITLISVKALHKTKNNRLMNMIKCIILETWLVFAEI